MREIKFEFILENKGLFFTTRSFTLDEIIDFSGEDTIYEQDNFYHNGEIIYMSDEDDWILDCNIVAKRQYTGLKDKNKEEIYESDICISKLIPKVFYVSEFNDGCFMFREYPIIKNDDWIGRVTDSELEVIGNIYENKELLK